MSSPTPPPTLIRAIGRWTFAALVLNSIVGSGIFALPANAAKFLGPAAPRAYLGAAAVMGVIVAAFVEVSSQFRDSGGPYLYARTALGRFIGIQTGWFLWLMRLSAGAAVANVFVTYLGELWPGATAPLPRAGVLALLLGGFAALNCRGVRAGAGLSNAFTIAKFVPLGLFIVVGLLLAPPAATAAAAVPATLGNWIDALVALIFAFGGFEGAMIPAAEAKDPRRDTPFALTFGLAVVAVCYLLIHVVAMRSVPGLADSARPLADAARAFAGPAGAAAIAVGALLSTSGWLSSNFVSAPRLTYALSERGDFPKMFGVVHPRFRTPHVSIVAFAVVVFALALYGSFYWNAILSVAARLVTYATTCGALIQLRRREPAANACRVPGGTTVAVLGIGICLALASRLAAAQLGVVAVVAGVATVNWLVVRRHRPPVNVT